MASSSRPACSSASSGRTLASCRLSWVTIRLWQQTLERIKIGCSLTAVIDAPEDAVSTTGGRSPSALSAMPEETRSDFSSHIHRVALDVGSVA
eukprot:5842647-Pyramimonas_sp.AAC.1